MATYTKLYALDFTATGDTVYTGVDKLEDNIDQLVSDLNSCHTTTRGDMIYKGASAVTRLAAAATAGSLLRHAGSGGDPSWTASLTVDGSGDVKLATTKTFTISTSCTVTVTTGSTVTLNSGTVLTLPNTGLHIMDTNASHDLIIKPGSNITADRTLTITTGDADRTLTINADSLINQSVQTTASPTFAGITCAGTVDLTGGTLTLDNDELSGDKVEGGTINAITINTLTIGTVANGNVTVGAGKTLDVSAGTLTLANDQVSGNAIDGGTISNFASTGIDDNASATALTINSNGHTGLGVTANANWESARAALEVGRGIALWSHKTAGTAGYIVSNACFDGTNYKYLRDGVAYKLYFENDGMVLDSAATGTSGNTVTWSTDDFRVNQGGAVYINDSANTKSTIGLTINQGPNDDEALALKSDDVAHGITDYTETDTYGYAKKYSSTSGGLSLSGFSEAEIGAVYVGYGGAQDTTDPPTTSASCTVQVVGAVKSVTGVTALGATGNLFAVVNNSTNEFIVKGDGELYSNQSATVGTFDDYNDPVMCSDLANVIAKQYSSIMHYNKDRFIAAKIMSHDGMVSLTKVQQLQLGAIGQLYRLVHTLCSRLGLDAACLLKESDIPVLEVN